MRVRRLRFQNIRLVRMGVAPRMRQLKTDAEIVVPSEFLPVHPAHLRTDVRQGLFRVFRNQQLLRIASPGVHDGSGLGAVKKFGSAPGKPQPAAFRELAGGAVVHAVPPFHGEDRPAVADGPALYSIGRASAAEPSVLISGARPMVNFWLLTYSSNACTVLNSVTFR